ncbi:DUF1302 family protein [Parvibaculum sp.]|uniref:DUF1302 domain-containing protein n=1 Tax=Parvibaculum sp. TaxID=2024848 RepID=UPI00391DFA19
MKRGSLRSVLLSSAAATMLIASAGTANAIEYNFGSVQVFFDTTISAGVSMRTVNTNHLYLPTSNGGPVTDTPDSEIIGAPILTGNTAPLPTNANLAGNDINTWSPKVAGSINTDDGRLNFNRGDLIGNTYKMTNDLQAKWQNYTFFTRVNSYYDAVLNSSSSYDRSPLVDGKADAARDIRLLDLYVSGDYDVGGLPLNVRLGKQVISWGESTFLLNGVNSANPIDVNAFRRPGAEIKEGLIPVWAIDASIGLPGNLSLEAFYQFRWEGFQLDRPGTPFSTSDVTSMGSGPGGNFNAVSFLTGGPGSGIFRNCSNPNPISTMFDAAYNGSGNNLRDCGADALDFGVFNSTQVGGGAWAGLSAGSTEALRLAYGDSGIVARDQDREPSNSGQYGIAARWYSEQLNNTEFGFYFMNYHSRLPIASERIAIDWTQAEVGTYSLAGPTTGQQSRLLQYNSCNAANGATAVVTQPNAALFGMPLGLSTATLDTLNSAIVTDPDGVLAAGLAYADQFYANALVTPVVNAPAASHFAGGIVGTDLSTAPAVGPAFAGMANPVVQANSLLALMIANCALVAQQSTSVAPGAAPYMVVDGAEIMLAAGPQATPAIGLYLEYPEDIRMYGFSFNTTLGTWGVQGDVTYRPNQPVQLDTDQLTINALRRGCVFEQITGGAVGSAFGAQDTYSAAGCGSVASGTQIDLQGYERTDIYTAQVGTTATYTASNPLIGFTGADLGILVTEVGMMYAPDAPSAEATAAPGQWQRRWQNVCTSGGTDLPLAGALGLATRNGCRPTSVSWGYVLLGQLQYNNAFGTAVTLNPTVAFSHGVSGNSPAPLSNYREGAKSVSLQLNGSYQQWRGGLSYTNFFGHEKYQGSGDMDFVSLNISYAF